LLIFIDFSEIISFWKKKREREREREGARMIEKNK
jgi:hypothetical protein